MSASSSAPAGRGAGADAGALVDDAAGPGSVVDAREHAPTNHDEQHSTSTKLRTAPLSRQPLVFIGIARRGSSGRRRRTQLFLGWRWLIGRCRHGRCFGCYVAWRLGQLECAGRFVFGGRPGRRLGLLGGWTCDEEKRCRHEQCWRDKPHIFVPFCFFLVVDGSGSSSGGVPNGLGGMTGSLPGSGEGFGLIFCS